MAKTFLLIAAISGLLAVALGAFGAHAMKARLTEDMLAVYQTGVAYHFYHTLALLVVALLIQQYPQAGLFQWSGWAMVAGLLIFSGSLYLLSITGLKWLGAITPIGGLAFMVGWLSLAVGVYQHISD